MLVRQHPIKFADPRKLILEAADRLLSVVDLMDKLEGRYQPVERAIGGGNTLQLNVIQNILMQHRLLK
ncbi:MAG TPA: hypothetical protein VKJ45_06750 [Blastocatellia bacterium]|nr:hypothetical protein [Blastocatellia bacterium]